MLARLSITWRLTLLVVLGAALVMGLVVGYSYLAARDLLQDEMVDRVHAQASAIAGRIEALQGSLEKATEGVALAAESLDSGDEAFYRILEKVMRQNVSASGIGLAFAADPSLGGGRRTAPYVYRLAETPGAEDGLVRKNLVDEDQGYDVTDWFSLPEALGVAVWTEPYFDEAGAAVMTTYAVPIYHSGVSGDPAAFMGVATCEVSLEWLTELLRSQSPGAGGYAFLISQNGTFISHPTPDLIMNETIFSIAEGRDDAMLRTVGRRMVRGGSGIADIVSVQTGQESWMAYCPIPSTGWSVSLVLPKQEVMQKVFELSRIQLLLGGAGMLLLVLVSVLIARTITHPIRELSAVTRVLALGDLDVALPRPRGGAEVVNLATSFAGMRDDLKRHIAELQAATAARARIEGELKVAAGIQLSLVPKTFPPFPERSDIDIFALLEPAREVGGDFYDFFLLEDRYLCFAVADVSDKGVPAALFMASTRSFLRAFLRDDRHPARVLAKLNAELETDNDACMFVTVFCGVLDLQTGECSYANGGHNSPYIARAATGAVEAVPRTAGVVLGIQTGVEFEEGVLTLRAGDRLFLYTDGVTEAVDRQEQQFGEERLIAVLARTTDESAQRVAEEAREAVREFAGDVDQFDDITVLVVRFLGGGSALGRVEPR